jgi:hypothetical protein
MSSIFWSLFFVLFYLFICIGCFRSLSLGVDDFENIQELDVQDFKQQQVGEQGKWPLTMLFQYAFVTLCVTKTLINLVSP